jgi:hypothetical protein
MQTEENDKCCELQVHVDNRFFRVNQMNLTTNNHQKTSSEGPGCDHDELHFDINCNKLRSSHNFLLENSWYTDVILQRNFFFYKIFPKKLGFHTRVLISP